MTREEAIEKLREWYFLDDNEREVLETLIPEIRVSKDEKIRRELIEHIKSNCETGFVLFQKFSPDDVIAWLEKQGEQEEPQVYETEDGEIITYSETDGYKVIEPKFKVSKEMKFRKFDIITNGKIEYEIKDIQKNQLGDWVYILHNDSIARLVLPLSSLPDGSIRWVCKQVDEQFELKQRMEE